MTRMFFIFDLTLSSNSFNYYVGLAIESPDCAGNQSCLDLSQLAIDNAERAVH